MIVTKALALTGVKVIMDDGLFKEVGLSGRPPLGPLDASAYIGQECFYQKAIGARNHPVLVADRFDGVESTTRHRTADR
jgi:hypothetical protein